MADILESLTLDGEAAVFGGEVQKIVFECFDLLLNSEEFGLNMWAAVDFQAGLKDRTPIVEVQASHALDG